MRVKRVAARLVLRGGFSVRQVARELSISHQSVWRVSRGFSGRPAGVAVSPLGGGARPARPVAGEVAEVLPAVCRELAWLEAWRRERAGDGRIAD